MAKSKPKATQQEPKKKKGKNYSNPYRRTRDFLQIVYIDSAPTDLFDKIILAIKQGILEYVIVSPLHDMDKYSESDEKKYKKRVEKKHKKELEIREKRWEKLRKAELRQIYGLGNGYGDLSDDETKFLNNLLLNELKQKQNEKYMFYEYSDKYYFDDTINYSTISLSNKLLNDTSMNINTNDNSNLEIDDFNGDESLLLDILSGIVVKAGEFKKPHLHIAYHFKNPKALKFANEYLKSLTNGSFVLTRNGTLKGTVRYMAHLDNADKAPYDPVGIRTYGDINIQRFLEDIETSLSSLDAFKILKNLINQNDITAICEFDDFMDSQDLDLQLQVQKNINLRTRLVRYINSRSQLQYEAKRREEEILQKMSQERLTELLAESLARQHGGTVGAWIGFLQNNDEKLILKEIGLEVVKKKPLNAFDGAYLP